MTVGLANQGKLFQRKYVLAADVDFNDESKVDSWYLGTEYYLWDSLALRTGLNSEGTNYGVGLDYKEIAIDYSYFKHDLLGDRHQVSITWLLESRKTKSIPRTIKFSFKPKQMIRGTKADLEIKLPNDLAIF